MEIKNTATNVFELGVNRGGSIRLWYEYFTKATIYACDIIDNVQIPELKTQKLRAKKLLKDRCTS